MREREREGKRGRRQRRGDEWKEREREGGRERVHK